MAASTGVSSPYGFIFQHLGRTLSHIKLNLRLLKEAGLELSPNNYAFCTILIIYSSYGSESGRLYVLIYGVDSIRDLHVLTTVTEVSFILDYVSCPIICTQYCMD